MILKKYKRLPTHGNKSSYEIVEDKVYFVVKSNAWDDENRHCHLHRRERGRLVFLKNPPFVYHSHLGETEQLYGFLVDTWIVLAQLLNFTWSVNEPQVTESRFRANVGDWNGMIAELVDGRADVALGCFIFTGKRAEVVDFTTPVSFVRYRFLLKRGDFSFDWNSYLLPLSLSSWFALFGTILLSSLALLWIYKRSGDEQRKMTVSGCLLRMLGFICQQGCDVTPSLISARLLHALMLLLGVLIFNLYSGTLISYIAIDRHELPFTSMTDLLEKRNYRMGVLGNSAIVELFSRVKEKIYKRTWMELVMVDFNNVVPTVLLGYQKVCTEAFTFFHILETATGYKGRINCSITSVRRDYFKGFGHLMLQRGSPYRAGINYYLGRLREGGVLTRLERHWWWEPNMDKKTEFSALSIQEVSLPFVALAVGMLTSLAVFAVEKIVWRMSTRGCRRRAKISISKEDHFQQFHRQLALSLARKDFEIPKKDVSN